MQSGDKSSEQKYVTTKTNKQDTWEILVTLVDTLSNTSKSLCPGAQIPYIKNPYNETIVLVPLSLD